MNATMIKFGYPDTLIRDYEHWVVLLRPAQVTAGSLILAAKGEATAYGSLSAAAFAEQGRIIADIEAMLSTAVDYEKINYLMLMMVDPHVHFHIFPRYGGRRLLGGHEFEDKGFPGPPDLKSARELDAASIFEVVRLLRLGH